MNLPPQTRLGTVSLAVRDLAATTTFYSAGVGLEVISQDGGHTVLGSRGAPLLELTSRPDLQPAPAGSAGLYHTAVLFEERTDLAAALYAAATVGVGRFTGSADHLVSLAFYFDDPEGNGVELYWDRPRDEWRWTDSEVAMDSLPLDPNRFIAEFRDQESEPTAPKGAAATIGHVHLKVGDIPTARAFYVDTLGLEPTMASWPSALFTAAGGYHHHIGMNIWESRSAGPRSPAHGLASFEILVPDEAALTAVAGRLEEADASFERNDTGLSIDDPWRTRITMRVA